MGPISVAIVVPFLIAKLTHATMSLKGLLRTQMRGDMPGISPHLMNIEETNNYIVLALIISTSSIVFTASAKLLDGSFPAFTQSMKCRDSAKNP